MRLARKRQLGWKPGRKKQSRWRPGRRRQGCSSCRCWRGLLHVWWLHQGLSFMVIPRDKQSRVQEPSFGRDFHLTLASREQKHVFAGKPMWAELQVSWNLLCECLEEWWSSAVTVPQDCMAMSRVIFDCHSWSRDTTVVYGIETLDATISCDAQDSLKKDWLKMLTAPRPRSSEQFSHWFT